MARRPGKKDACMVVVLVGASLLAGLGYMLSEGLRWLV